MASKNVKNKNKQGTHNVPRRGAESRAASAGEAGIRELKVLIALLRLSYRRQRVARPPPTDKYKVTVCQSRCVQPRGATPLDREPPPPRPCSAPRPAPHGADAGAPNDLQLGLNMTEQSLASGGSASVHLTRSPSFRGGGGGVSHSFTASLRLHVAALCKPLMSHALRLQKPRGEEVDDRQ